MDKVTHNNCFSPVSPVFICRQMGTLGCEGALAILVGNKSDKEASGDREVSRERGQDFAKQHGMDFVEASARDGVNTEEILCCVGSKLLRRAKPTVYTSLSELAKLQKARKCSCQ